MATSNEVLRPVILSRPENTAVGLMIFCAGGAVTISSPGCGAVLAGSGGPRGRWPGAGGSAAGSADVPGGGGQDFDGVRVRVGAGGAPRGAVPPFLAARGGGRLGPARGRARARSPVAGRPAAAASGTGPGRWRAGAADRRSRRIARQPAPLPPQGRK